MLIFDEHTEPIILDNIDIPFPVSHFWILDLEMMDFTLKELLLSEELTATSLTIRILGRPIQAPANWNILVYSPETSDLDVVEFGDLSKQSYSAVVYNHKTDRLMENNIVVQSYDGYTKVQTPSLVKNTMLCHPIGNDYWACIAPTDSYNRFIKGKVIGDLF